jgi:hypothetical protein
MEAARPLWQGGLHGAPTQLSTSREIPWSGRAS